MANGGNQLFVIGEFLDDLDRPVFHSQRIGVGDAARQQQRGVILGVDVIEHHVGRDRVALHVMLHPLDRVGLDRGERHLDAGIEQRLTRLEQFVLLETIGREDQDVRIGKIGHRGVSGLG